METSAETPNARWRDWAFTRWAGGHPQMVDGLIAGAVTVYSLVIHAAFRTSGTGYDFQRPAWWTVLLVVAATTPLTWRRRFPVAVALAVVAGQIVLELFLVNATSWINMLIALYSLGAYAHGSPRRRAALVIAAGIAGLLVLGIFENDVQLEPLEAIGAAAILLVAYIIGDNVQRRRTLVRTLSERADRAERERELLASQRVVEERGRVARDLHDVVAHSVSVMVIQATAARRNLDRDPAAAAELLANVETTGRRTMGELRQILGVLRDPASDAAPTTAVLADLNTLARSIPDLDVDLHTTGSLTDVPAGVALSAYRVVQEALTNAHRHGGPGVRVDVVVECAPDHVNVSVSDDGRGASTQAASGPSGGYGLVGMGERVAAFGGQLRVGPRRSGGWEVRAHFPLHESPTTP